MRRMIDPTKVGGIPSTIEFDKDGNRKVKKNLGVDGKLTLKSLVRYENPDGDITKAQMHMYSIFLTDSCYFDICTYWNNKDWTSGSKYSDKDILTNPYYKELHKLGIYSASGYYHAGTPDSPINLIVSQFRIGYNNYEISGYDLNDSTYKTLNIQISENKGLIKRF